MEPSPTPDATRFTDPRRTSPTANTPGTLVSSRPGSRSSVQLWGALAVAHQRRAGQDEAVLVALHHAVQPVGAGLRADEDEQRAGVHTFARVGARRIRW